MKKKTLLFVALMSLLFIIPFTEVKAESTYEARIGETSYLKLSNAFTAAVDGDVIYLLKDFSQTASISLTGSKSLTLTSEPGSHFTITKAYSGVFFYIRDHCSLTVENITINGNNITNEGAIFDIGVLSSAEGHLIIKAGTTIINCKTGNGAAVIQLRSGRATIEGGTFTANGAGVGIPLIYVGDATTLDLFGGVFSQNYTYGVSDYGAITVGGGALLNIGGNVQVLENTNSKYGDERDIYFVDDVKRVNAKILSDFTGNIGIWSKNYYQRNAIFATILNNADLSNGTFFDNRNEYLFGLQDSTDVKWDYKYENATVITAPTATSSGLFRQTAIGAPGVTRDITLNPLSADDYTIDYDPFDAVSSKITYTLKDLSYGDVHMDYDLPLENDPGYTWSLVSSPTTTTVGELHATHSVYPGLEITGYVLPIINTTDYAIAYVSPTASEPIGKIQFTFPAIASNPVVFEQSLLRSEYISYDYDSISLYAESGSQYVVLARPNTPGAETVWGTGTGGNLDFALNEDTEYAVFVKPLVSGVLAEAYVAYSFTTPNQTAYLLLEAKKSAKQELDTYLSTITNPSATVIGIIAAAKAEIDAAGTSVGFDERVLLAISDVEDQILLEEKNIAKQELDTYLSTLTSPSTAVTEIIATAKAEIDSASSSDGFDAHILATISDVEDQILLEEKNLAKQELDTYLSTLTNPSEPVTGIIATAKTAIDSAVSSVSFGALIDQAIADVEDRILLEEKNLAKQELDTYLSTVANPSTIVTEIITTAKNEIDLAVTATGFDERVLAAISDVEDQVLLETKTVATADLQTMLANITDPSMEIVNLVNTAITDIAAATTPNEVRDVQTQAVTDVEERMLLEDKTEAKLELDTYLSTLTNPSAVVTEIIATAKANIDASVTSDGFDAQILATISDVENQILLEEKNIAKQELDAYLSTLTNPSETITGIITTAKAEIDAAVSSVGFEDRVDQAIAGCEAQLLDEAKADAISALQNWMAGITNATTELLALADTAENEIEASTTPIAVNTLLSQALIDLQDQLLSDVKADAVFDLLALLDGINDPSGEVIAIVSTAQNEIATSITPNEVHVVLAQAVTDVEAQVLLEDKNEAKLELDTYFSTLNNPSAAVTEIIATAKANIDSAVTSDGFDERILKAMNDVKAQILLEEKTIAKQELDTYLSTLTYPSTDVMGIITTAKNEMDAASSSADFANRIRQAIADCEAQLLDEAKSSQSNLIDQTVSALLPPEITYSPELQALINALKSEIANASSIEEIETLVEQSQQAIEIQATHDVLSYEFADIFNTYSNDQAYQYSEAGLSQLETIFDNAALLLQNPSLTVLEKNAILEDAIADFDTVSIIVMGEVRPNDPTVDETTLDPDQIYVSLNNENGMQKGTHVLVERKETILRTAELFNLIDQGNIDTFFSSLTTPIARTTLGKQVVFAELEVRLLNANDQMVVDFSADDRYRVSMFLPEELRLRENIHVVFIAEGKIEVFDVAREGDWISFTTNHFGAFHLIGDPVSGDEGSPIAYINLWWLIILLATIILMELGTILWKMDRKSQTKRLQATVLPLAILIPINAYTILWIEIIILIILFGIILFLFADRIFQKKTLTTSQEPTVISDSSQTNPSLVIVETNPVEETKILTDRKTTDVRKMSFPGPTGEWYSFSLTARMHQAPNESMIRYNQIKNHILRYPGVKTSTSWNYERFIRKGKTVMKLTLSGQTMRVYFQLDQSDLKDSIYQLEYQSIKEHETTPYMMLIKGPRNLQHALQIIDLILKKTGEVPGSLPENDYRLLYLTKAELIEKGLVKVNKGRESQ